MGIALRVLAIAARIHLAIHIACASHREPVVEPIAVARSRMHMHPAVMLLLHAANCLNPSQNNYVTFSAFNCCLAPT